MKKFIVAVFAAAALAATAQAQTPARLDANTASAAQLDTVSELTAAQKATIASKRPFAGTAAFDAAVGAGLSAEQKTALYAKVFVPIDLNKASREEIMLIPGMTRRMAHEFEEYRPYTSLDQFNKEIGKYVDQTEVARLRSYVVLK
jgi:radical SAM superfamily enzyme with C-terminal helix-hairpin-helix motif